MLEGGIDAEVLDVLRRTGLALPPRLTADMIPELRRAYRMTAAAAVGDRRVIHQQHRVEVPGGEIALSVFAPAGSTALSLPIVYFIHGGGMFSGDRFLGATEYLDWVESLGVLVASVEYRLAPEHPDPIPVEDCFRGLEWVAARHELIGADPARVVVAGVSAGGGLAAGLSLLARDRRGPALAGVLLLSPMLDDRVTGPVDPPVAVETWDALSNRTAWQALLGSRHGSDQVSVYAAPARSTDLGSLPPIYIDCGTAEWFHDQSVEFAGRIQAAGGEVELNRWPGGVHGFDLLAPGAALAESARAARAAWIGRLLSR